MRDEVYPLGMNEKGNSDRLWGSLLKDLAIIAAILAVGGMIGTAVNWKLVRGAWEGGYALEATPAQSSEVNLSPISLQEIRALSDLKKAVIVDARREFFYAKEHIPGSLTLPLVQYEDRIGAFQQQVGHDRLLIIYCSGYGCEDSHQLGLKLQGVGYKRMRVFSGGLPEWKQAGLPTEGTDAR